MRHHHLIFFLLSVGMLFAALSCQPPPALFAILNATHEEITVTLTLNNTVPKDFVSEINTRAADSRILSVVDVEDYNEHKGNTFRMLGRARPLRTPISVVGRSWTLTVPAHTALLVDLRGHNYTDHYLGYPASELHTEFSIYSVETLSVKTPQGTIRIEGLQIVNSFLKVADYVYELRIQNMPGNRPPLKGCLSL